MTTSLPSLLDDLPGRAVMAVNPRVTAFNTAVSSWSKLQLLFCGVDGRWRRLDLGDLGLSEDLLYGDTYGAGALSTDGRWWVGRTDDGLVALDLATGRSVLLTQRAQGDPRWVRGRHALVRSGIVVTVPGGSVRTVPYQSWQVGFEPDGTPLSLARGPDGVAQLVTWRGGRPRVGPEVPWATPRGDLSTRCRSAARSLRIG